MKRTIGKTAVIMLVTMLVASSMLVLQARAQPIETTVSLISIEPYPVGVGQTIVAIGLIAPSPPEGEVFTGASVTITPPSGYPVILGPFNTDDDGVFYFSYTFDVVGTFYIQLSYDGDDYYEEIIYLPSTSPSYPIQVGPIYPGDNVTVYPDPTDPRVTLTFEHITSEGTATMIWKDADPPEGVPPLGGIIGYYYDFEVTFQFTGIVKVGIPYDEALLDGAVESKLTLWHYEIVGDVNGDGKVNLRDILIIKLALGAQRGSRRWNPACDLNSDGKVNLQDLVLALRNFGKTASAWRNITTRVDTADNIVYGETPNFPPFGVRL